MSPSLMIPCKTVPSTLPVKACSLLAPVTLPVPEVPATAAIARQAPAPEGTVDSGNLPAFVHVAMRRDLALSPAGQEHAILARVQTIQTRAQAAQYINEVRAKLQAARSAG